MVGKLDTICWVLESGFSFFDLPYFCSAFKQGKYDNPDPTIDDFGDGRYGNLEATVAAIILDPEARSIVIDADPTSGSLVEPMMKITRVMRAMEFETNDLYGERLRMRDLQVKIGQEPHR